MPPIASVVRRAASLLFWEAILALWIVRLLLWCVPYSTVVKRCARRQKDRAYPGIDAYSISSAIRAASRCTFRSTCLVESLAGLWLMNRHGHPAQLRIGVAKSGEAFKAHAWLEHESSIILSSVNPADFILLDLPHVTQQ